MRGGGLAAECSREREPQPKAPRCGHHPEASTDLLSMTLPGMLHPERSSSPPKDTEVFSRSRDFHG